MSKPEELVGEYMNLKSAIDQLELRSREIKNELTMLLTPDGVEGVVWKFNDVPVQWVKGRRKETLDKKKLKLELILSGVDASVLTAAFEKATTVSMGTPHLRIGGNANEKFGQEQE